MLWAADSKGHPQTEGSGTSSGRRPIIYSPAQSTTPPPSRVVPQMAGRGQLSRFLLGRRRSGMLVVDVDRGLGAPRRAVPLRLGGTSRCPETVGCRVVTAAAGGAVSAPRDRVPKLDDGPVRYAEDPVAGPPAVHIGSLRDVPAGKADDPVPGLLAVLKAAGASRLLISIRHPRECSHSLRQATRALPGPTHSCTRLEVRIPDVAPRQPKNLRPRRLPVGFRNLQPPRGRLKPCPGAACDSRRRVG